MLFCILFKIQHEHDTATLLRILCTFKKITDVVLGLSRFGVKVKLVADDAKLYVKVVNTVAIDELRKALAALNQWSDEWQLSVSISKCCVLCIGTVDAADHFILRMCHLPLLLLVVT